MRLKKLAIFGFKSFADKTVLQFDAGITCIVGPNGCGKSNIADAFRWVLGEQSANSMRGAKMPDIIFAGASHRKPLNVAEVSLTLSEIQGKLPIDYEEITLTRRLHRSGKSEYLLNGNPVRLKDLQSLFLDSGIGKNAFSIFEQGKIDQIISYSPLERRYIFEEAAGILRFLQRKKESLKRLEQADLNLSRVLDIHREVEKQIKLLESQAYKARVFKEQKNLLEQMEKASYVLRWKGIEKKINDLRIKQEKQNQHLEEHQKHGAVLMTQSQEAKQLMQQHDKALLTQNEKVLTLRNQQELELRESQSLQQRLKETRQREKKLKNELEDLILAYQNRQKMLVEMRAKRQRLDKDWNEAETQWVNQQERVQKEEKEVIQLRLELDIKQQAHLKCFQQHSQWQSELKQTEIRIENHKERRKQLENHYQQLLAGWQQLVQTTQERKKHLQQLSALVDSHKDRLEQYEEDLKKISQESEKIQREVERLRKKIIEGKARHQVLVRMREDYEGFSSGSKRLLQETQNPQSSLYQALRPLYEYIDSQAEIAEALAVVLRAYAHTLVTESEEDFKRVLAFAEQAGLQDYSLMCIEWLQRIKLQTFPIENKLMDQVVPNPLIQHFLKAVTLVSSHEEVLTAWMQGKCQEGWTHQGFFLDYRGVLFKIKPNDNQVFMRESELKILEEDLSLKEEQLNKLEQSLLISQQRRSQLQMERLELDKMLRRDEMKLVEVNFGLQRALGDQEKHQSEQGSCEQEMDVLKQNCEQQDKVYQELERQFAQIQHELSQLQQEKDVLQVELNKQETALRIQQQGQKEKGALYQQLVEDRRQLIHQYDLLEAKEQDHDKHVQRIEEELAELEEKIVQFDQIEREGKTRLDSFKEELQEAITCYADFEKGKEKVFHQAQQVEEHLTFYQKELKRLENELSQIQIQLAQQQAASQAISNELIERYGLTMEDAFQLNLPLDRSLEQTEKQVRSLRQALQDTGDVNLTAIEDLEEYQVRYAFLKQQMEDMQLSKSELLKIIQQLDSESRKLFQETFEVIRNNFKKNFQILFNGGEADLQFTQSHDVLEAGIEISAKPPGKQMRSISLLSGGEKCLTAVALLFAIFEVKPAPFCILDEIDAPLDDTNVERFVNVVKHFVDRCQFLIITHNKRTMAIGDMLFGISMEEKGISKLLALEFAHKMVPEASLI